MFPYIPFDICISYSKIPIHVFYPFVIGLLLSYMISLYNLDIKPYQIYDLQILFLLHKLAFHYTNFNIPI